MKGQRNSKLAVRNLNQFKARNLDCKQTKLPSPLESFTLYRGQAVFKCYLTDSTLNHVFMVN